MLLRFRNFIKEELTPEQKADVDTWPKRSKKATEATDRFFGKKNENVYEKLQNTSDKSEVHKSVEQHLGQKIDPEDYKQGLHTDKYGRKAKIGKTLNKTPEGQKLLKDFNEDSTRGGKNLSGLTAHTTRSAHGVAGQTSGNQSWEDESCKNITDGVNKHYLKHEIRHGTVVSYLKDNSGKELARATFQPHHDDHGNTIYKRDSYYGIKHAQFEKHTQDMEKRLSNPGGENNVFVKHPKVYNDNRTTRVLHPNATPEHITHGLNNEDPEVRRIAMLHPNATAEHITRGLKDQDHEVRYNAAKHKNATPEHITTALNDKNTNVRSAAIKNPNATPEHITKALNDKSSLVRSSAFDNPNATPEHINRGLNDEEQHVRYSASDHPNMSPENVTKALKDEDLGVRSNAIKHPNATHEQITHGINDEDDDIRRSAIQNPNATPEHITKALNDKYSYVRNAAILHPKVSAEHITHALKDPNSEVRYRAIIHPNATKEHYNTGLTDKNPEVKKFAKNKIQELDKSEMKTESVTFYKLKQWIS